MNENKILACQTNVVEDVSLNKYQEIVTIPFKDTIVDSGMESEWGARWSEDAFQIPSNTMIPRPLLISLQVALLILTKTFSDVKMYIELTAFSHAAGGGTPTLYRTNYSLASEKVYGDYPHFANYDYTTITSEFVVIAPPEQSYIKFTARQMPTVYNTTDVTLVGNGLTNIIIRTLPPTYPDLV